MHLSSIIFTAAAVSAIDLRLHYGGDCKGGALVCFGLNPNVCCGIPSGGVGAVGFWGIPPAWNLDCRGHENGRCRDLKTLEVAYNTNFKCLRNGPYTGGGYGFRNNKVRSVDSCTEHKLPDQYLDGNGKNYTLTGMTEAELLEFISHTKNGTVPETYKSLLN